MPQNNELPPNGREAFAQLLAFGDVDDFDQIDDQREPSDEELFELSEEETVVLSEDVLASIPIDDATGLYLRQMAQEPLLTPQEEITLAQRMQAGKEAKEQLETFSSPEEEMIQDLYAAVEDGLAARDRFIAANTRLVVSIAKQYIGRRLPFLDVIQEGNIGMIKAVDRFDYLRGYKFSTYGTWWIRQSITHALSDQTRTIRIPQQMNDRIGAMYRTMGVLEQELGRRPRPEELADAMEIPPDQVIMMLEASRHPVSLEHPVGDDERVLGDFIEDNDTPKPEFHASRYLRAKGVQKVLKEVLSERHQQAVELRFGLNGNTEHTLEEIGNLLGVSRNRVEQMIQREALVRLRHPRVRRKLEEFIDDE